MEINISTCTFFISDKYLPGFREFLSEIVIARKTPFNTTT